MARNLPDQAAREIHADILIISEQPRGPPNDDRSLSDFDNTAQIVLTGSASMFASEVRRGRYHVGAVVERVAFYSCYMPPPLSIAQFTEVLEELGADCGRHPRTDQLIAGDFNAKVTTWGSTRTDNKGTVLEEFAAALNLKIGNVGNTPTFQSGTRSSIIDFTLSRLTRGRCLTGWTVDQSIFTGSDHHCMRFEIQNARTSRIRGTPTPPEGWVIKRLDTEKLTESKEAKKHAKTAGWERMRRRRRTDFTGTSRPVATAQCRDAVPRTATARRTGGMKI